MNISRGFLLTGAVHLLIGILLGSCMGASGNPALAPVHAHINLLGLALMTVRAGLPADPGAGRGTG